MFKLPDYNTLSSEKQIAYTEFKKTALYASINAPEPYGTLSESMFTLFRVLTSDNWSEIRYNLINAREYGLINVSPTFITTFHVVWFILAAFLLLNLVVGAIINNYQIIMEESRQKKREKEGAN
jgi:voltage-gated sodium channel